MRRLQSTQVQVIRLHKNPANPDELFYAAKAAIRMNFCQAIEVCGQRILRFGGVAKRSKLVIPLLVLKLHLDTSSPPSQIDSTLSSEMLQMP